MSSEHHHHLHHQLQDQIRKKNAIRKEQPLKPQLTTSHQFKKLQSPPPCSWSPHINPRKALFCGPFYHGENLEQQQKDPFDRVYASVAMRRKFSPRPCQSFNIVRFSLVLKTLEFGRTLWFPRVSVFAPGKFWSHVLKGNVGRTGCAEKSSLRLFWDFCSPRKSNTS